MTLTTTAGKATIHRLKTGVPGFDEVLGVLPAIFDLFVQDTRAMDLDGSGLGIGLAVVRELVESHGGTVVATSAGADLGSEFVVTLPGMNPSPGAGLDGGSPGHGSAALDA